MGYETKVYVIHQVENTTEDENGKQYVSRFNQVLASVNMSKVYGDFNKMFTKELEKEDKNIVLYDVNGKQTRKDKYNKPLLYTDDIEKVVKYLENSLETEYYRRDALLLGLLKGIKAEDWNFNSTKFSQRIILATYGY